MAIIKTNAQKTVFTMLVLTLILEFGSLTKIQKIWSLAFTGGGGSSGSFPGGQQQTGGTSFGTFSTQPTHPATTQHPVVSL